MIASRTLARRALAPMLLVALVACGRTGPATRVDAGSLALGHLRRIEDVTPTTTTTAPPTTTTTAAAWESHADHQPARASRAAPIWPATSGSAAGCMDNAPHSSALAHACWDGLIAQYPWPVATMFSVMMCESHGNPWDVGIPTRYGRAVGLMQDMNGPTDPASNVAAAYQKYEAGGLGPWVSSRSCWG